MRRFTQTFVLGTHSPRMYYVHNDIFRYQDMLLSDEEGESQSREEDTDPPQEVQPDVIIIIIIIISIIVCVCVPKS